MRHNIIRRIFIHGPLIFIAASAALIYFGFQYVMVFIVIVPMMASWYRLYVVWDGDYSDELSYPMPFVRIKKYRNEKLFVMLGMVPIHLIVGFILWHFDWSQGI